MYCGRRQCSGCRLCSGIHLFSGGLGETVRQRLRGMRVEALQHYRTGGAARAANVVVTEQVEHNDLISVSRPSPSRAGFLASKITLETGDRPRQDRHFASDDAVAQRRAKFIHGDFEGVARRRLDAVGERQRGSAEVMHVDITGAQELGVLEVMKLKVGQAVAHVALAREEFTLPQHLPAAQDAAMTLQVRWQLADPQLRAKGAGTQLEWAR